VTEGIDRALVVSASSGGSLALHRNMNIRTTPELVLDDLLADLRHARRSGDMDRLALISCCEVRRCARQVGQHGVSENSSSMLLEQPHCSREAFLGEVDELIGELEQARFRLCEAWPVAMALRPGTAPEQTALADRR
jgi:hypothetical protein